MVPKPTFLFLGVYCMRLAWLAFAEQLHFIRNDIGNLVRYPSLIIKMIIIIY
jgi:hypothetical protein